MTVEIKNLAGDVIYTLDGDSLEWAWLKGADLEGADLEGANFEDAYLEGANFKDADLKDAYLKGAYLEDANLNDAYLGGARLKGAWLKGAKGIADLGQRSDGYQFYAQWRKGSVWILAGCRYFPVKEAAAHWKKTRPGTPLGAESMEFIRRAKWVAKHHGWGK